MPEEAVPINKASDEELFVAITEGVLSPLKEEFAKALVATAEVKGQGGDAATMQDRIAPLWKEVWHKLDSADYVLGHIKLRVTKLRSLGILEGDPREAEVLKVAAP